MEAMFGNQAPEGEFRMKHLSLRPLSAAIVLALSAGVAQSQESGPRFTFSGFGTLAVVHSSEDQADFAGNQLQANGAGATRNPSTNPDSKLAGQVNAIFNDQVSAVLQVVSQYRYDASWVPQVEWLNVKYKPTSEISLRIGRIAMPVYLMSESRLVGYAHVWARPPQDVYGVMPLTSNDGVDASWSRQFGSGRTPCRPTTAATRSSSPVAARQKPSRAGASTTPSRRAR